MFSEGLPEISNEDKINILAGYLPNAVHLLQIIPATKFYAKIVDKNEDEIYIPLIAWAFMKNGNIFPLVYNHMNRNHLIAFAVEGFQGITHEDFLSDDEDDEDEEEKFKPVV